MNTDIEQVLKEGMERHTSGLSMPAGLAHRAARDLRQRQHRLRVATAAGTATAVAATGAVVAEAGGASSPATGPRLQTTAYVVSHVKSALAPASRVRLIARTVTRYSPGFNEAPVPGSFEVALGKPSSLAHWQIGTAQGWQYRGARRDITYSPTGQPIFESGLSGTWPVVTTAVIYRSRTWWRVKGPGPGYPQLPDFGPGASAMVAGGFTRSRVSPPPSWPVVILQDLASHQYRVAGHQRVDGVNALTLVARGATAADPETIWVNPKTYLPVRTLVTMAYAPGQHPDAWTVRTDFRFLPPTPANLAQLKAPVPAGFSRVPAP